jgi:hypothetical protein
MSADVCPAHKYWYALLCQCSLSLSGAEPPLILHACMAQTGTTLHLPFIMENLLLKLLLKFL